MDILQNDITQMGAIGMIVFGLAWFARTMLTMFINNLKENQEQLRKKDIENAGLEKEFRLFLQASFTQNQEIIKENSAVFRELTIAISKQTAYFKTLKQQIK